MSTEARKLLSRSQTLRHLHAAHREMEQAEKTYGGLTQELQRQIRQESDRLLALIARIETWPVTADERYHARLRQLGLAYRKRYEETR